MGESEEADHPCLSEMTHVKAVRSLPMDSARIVDLYRYPVKGLSPERLAEAQLRTGDHFPGDRLYAIENGPSGFDPAQPAFQPKTRFLMLMKNERLALLRTRFVDAERKLIVTPPDAAPVEFDLGSPDGRAKVEAFFALYCAEELRDRPRLLEAGGSFRFTDSARSGFVSLLNLSSVKELGEKAGTVLDPLRFRANVHLDGWPAWQEVSLVGKIITIGSTRLEVLKPIDRCLATHVDPTSGVRDVDVVGTLRRTYGHIECGIYARVLTGGKITPGDEIAPEPDLFG